jgi:hypothetical protein
MSAAALTSRVGSYSLGFQCLLLLASIFAFILKLGPVSGWLFVASLAGGLSAFLSGFAASLATRRITWLGLSAAAIFLAFFSLLIGVSLSGGFGV